MQGENQERLSPEHYKDSQPSGCSNVQGKEVST